MINRRRKWTRARRARQAETIRAKKEAGLPKTLPPVIVQYVHGKFRTLRLQTIEVYVPEEE
jgi:hypothetical protein